MNGIERRHAVLLTKPECALCDQAESIVLRLAGRFGVSIDIADVASDEDLRAQYEHRVPVLLGVGGRVLAEGAMSSLTVQRALVRVRLGL